MTLVERLLQEMTALKQIVFELKASPVKEKITHFPVERVFYFPVEIPVEVEKIVEIPKVVFVEKPDKNMCSIGVGTWEPIPVSTSGADDANIVFDVQKPVEREKLDEKDVEKVWPRPGERWKFNDVVPAVQTYEDSNGKTENINNSMACRGGNKQYSRTLEILEVSESGNMVKIKGTHNMEWIRGWIQAVDSDGRLIFEKA